MATIEKRLTELERADAGYAAPPPLVVFIHGLRTPEQQLQIEEAQKMGRPVALVHFVKPPEPNDR